MFKKCPVCDEAVLFFMTASSLDQMRSEAMRPYWGESRRGKCQFFIIDESGMRQGFHYMVPSTDPYIQLVWPKIRSYYKFKYNVNLSSMKWTGRITIIQEWEF